MSLPPGGVVLLHGHGRRGASLRRLARALERQGYPTLIPGYRYRRSLATVVDDLRPRLNAFAAETGGPLHFVTHSLGGLVVRALLNQAGTLPVGRVVMLGPPNRGSEWADLLFRLRLDRLVLGAAGAHLRTVRAAAVEAMLGPAMADLGIIAGDRALDPVFPGLVLRGPSDGKVTVAATRLDGADHLLLPVSHTLMVYNREVARQVICFLGRGRFDRGAAAGTPVADDARPASPPRGRDGVRVSYSL